MFLIILKYLKPVERIDELVPARNELLKRSQLKIIVSGRMEPRIGAVGIVNAKSEEEIWDLIKQDPFYIDGAAEYEVIKFIPANYDSRFECLLS